MSTNPSHREQVLAALKAVWEAALPNADVKRNADKPSRVPPGGMVIIRDGDPGEPDVSLSPPAYTYEHEVPVEVATYESASKPREQVLDEMLQAFGLELAEDRTLGGLCEWVEVSAPSPDDASLFGAEPIRWTILPVTCVYTTTSPLA